MCVSSTQKIGYDNGLSSLEDRIVLFELCSRLPCVVSFFFFFFFPVVCTYRAHTFHHVLPLYLIGISVQQARKAFLEESVGHVLLCLVQGIER